MFSVEELLKEKDPEGIDLHLESYTYIAFSEDCRYIFADRKVYWAEWELL